MKPLDLDAQRNLATELVALLILSDGTLASREVEALDRHGISQILGIPRDQLLQAVISHCRRLLERREQGDPVRLVDIERFEMTLDRITDPALRELVSRAMFVLSKADGVISPPEQTLLRNMLTRWEIPLERLRD